MEPVYQPMFTTAFVQMMTLGIAMLLIGLLLGGIDYALNSKVDAEMAGWAFGAYSLFCAFVFGMQQGMAQYVFGAIYLLFAGSCYVIWWNRTFRRYMQRRQEQQKPTE